MNKVYIAIDLKSFYASCECVIRGLDPLRCNLVVADTSRTEKTICLAVSPSLKEYHIPGRARLFEVIQRVKEINQERLKNNNYKPFIGRSYDSYELKENKALELDFIAATPSMQRYIDISSKIYEIYLKYVSKDDIHVYSIDEVFIDATPYLNTYKLTPYQFAEKLIKDVLKNTGITATAGIGTNLYLAKVAMDILAKHIKADRYGIRIAELDEMSYREKLWTHEPLSDFWMIGHGYERRLNNMLLYNMGDVCRYALNHEDKLYNEFGVNAEILIDHAFGIEPCTMKDIKNFIPQSKSLGEGQVLHEPYPYDKAYICLLEMVENITFKLYQRNYVAKGISLFISYDHTNKLDGEVVKDYIGRIVPKPASGSIMFDKYTSSFMIIKDYVKYLYKKIVDKNLSIRRINVSFFDMIPTSQVPKDNNKRNITLFDDIDEIEKEEKKEDERLSKEKNMQDALLKIKNKYGKNSVVKGMDLLDGATLIERNNEIGGHKK